MLDEVMRPGSVTEYQGLHQLVFKAMGSNFDLWIAVDSEQVASKALVAAKRFIDEAEQVMSRFREDSDLSELNGNSGKRKQVLPLLFEVIGVALDAAALSFGIYDPTVLPSLMAAGYDRNFDEIESDALQNDVTGPPADSSWSDITLDPSDCSVTSPSGVLIDLGGIGKAWTAHRAADLLSQTGPCIVSAGGDIAVRGQPYPGEGWLVGIKDPLHAGRQITTLELTTCGVATSGTDHRRWTRNGIAGHHLIDPRTGQSAETDLMSVTAIAFDVLAAERLALSAMILGSEQGLSLIENDRGSEGLLVFSDGRHITTSQFDTLLASGGATR